MVGWPPKWIESYKNNLTTEDAENAEQQSRNQKNVHEKHEKHEKLQNFKLLLRKYLNAIFGKNVH